MPAPRLSEDGEVLGFRAWDRDVTGRRRDEGSHPRLSRVHAMLSTLILPSCAFASARSSARGCGLQ